MKNLVDIKKYFKSESAKTVAIFTGGNFVVAIVGAISGLVYARWIDPEILGEFRKYGILTQYLGFGIIFVDGAFQRHFLYYLGKNKKKEAFEIASYAKWWYLMLVTLGILVFGVLALRSIFLLNYRAAMGWFIQIPAYSMATYGLYLKVLYRSNDDFRLLNKNMLLTSAVGVILLPIVYFLKYWGITLRFGLQNYVNLIVHIKNVPYKIKAKFNKEELLKLAKISLPLQVPAYVDSYLLKATISFVILKYLGERDLGIYGMAITMQGFLLVFSRSINQILTTKIMLNYGKHDSLSKSINYILKPTILAVLLGGFIVISFLLIVTPVFNNFLPKYTGSLPIIRILVLEIIIALANGPQALFISGLYIKTRFIIKVSMAFVVLFFIFILPVTLENIAWSLIYGELFALLLGYIILVIYTKKEDDKINNNQ